MVGDDGFLSRWSRRKAEVRRGALPAEPAPAAATPPAGVVAVPQRPDESDLPATHDAPATAELPALPTLEDVAQLTPASDFSRFVAPGVDGGVKNAAMRKLFADPHFNVMDGLDTYIDDYGKPSPIAPAKLRQMAQAKFLGLFDDEEKAEAERLAAAPAIEAPAVEPPPAADNAVTDENADLQLQPDDAARRARAGEGAGPGEG